MISRIRRIRADDSLSDALRSNLTRLIAYAKSADPDLQRQVAEKLANEAVKCEFSQIFHGRLKNQSLLVPPKRGPMLLVVCMGFA